MQGSVADLDRALTATGKVVAGIAPHQWSAPSFCEGWSVRAETNHLVGGLRIFTAQIEGTETGGGHDDTSWLGADPAGSYVDAAAADLRAWRRTDALARSFDLSFAVVPGPMGLVIHLTEVIVHGLDLAVCTDQDHLADDVLADGLLTLMHRMGMDAFRRPGIFGPELPASPTDPAHRRLLAFLGRRL
jgi:uncharacterized protein (TIGR03086 family)